MMPILSPSTSLSFLDRLREGDDVAWQRLVTLYTPLLRCWLRPTSLQLFDIDDITQNALAVVVRRLPEYRHNGRPGAFRAWLRSIIQNVLREHLRTGERRRLGGDELLAQLAIEDSDLNLRWDREHDQHILRGLLSIVREEFSPSTWRAFWRTAVDGAPGPQVAHDLNMSLNAVHVARSRVLARLREEAQDFLDLG